jgi:hypothetical protein
MSDEKYLIPKDYLDAFLDDGTTHTAKVSMVMEVLSHPARERSAGVIVISGIAWCIVTVLRAIGTGLGALFAAIMKATEPQQRPPKKNGGKNNEP